MRKEHVKVNNSLTLDKDRKYYCNEKEKFKAKISCETESEELFVMEQGQCRVTSLLRGNANRKKHIPVLCKPSDKEENSVVFEGIKEGTDLKYHATKAGVKEDIIVNERADEYIFPFVLKCENVSYRYHEKAKRVSFINKETEEEVFCIPAPFMYDANGILSKAVDYKVEELGEDELLLTVVADNEWINSEERVFPVVIDPQIVVSGEEDVFTYSWLNDDMKLAETIEVEGGDNIQVHTIGVNSDNETSLVNRMYFDIYIPDIVRYSRMKKAELKITQYSGNVGAEAPLIGLYQVAPYPDADDPTPVTDDKLIDFEVMRNGENVLYTYDITDTVDKVSKGADNYYCFVLKQIDETIAGNSIVIYSSEEENFSPEICITYESNFAIGSAYGTNSHEIGRFGQGSIDLMYGNLMFDSEDFVWSGNRMPVTIKHLYNSTLRASKYTGNGDIGLDTAPFYSMNIGYGYKLNIMQGMISEGFIHEGVQHNGYVYTGENGEEVYFVLSSDTKTVEETGVSYNLYKDVEDTGLVYDPEERTLIMGDEVYLFDESGRLIKITDGYGNHMDITYTSGKITSVTDGAGRVFSFTYNDSGFLTMITAPDGTTVMYAYTGSYLSEIIYTDNTKAVISHSSGKVTSVVLKDANDVNLYKIEYSYSNEVVSKIVEYGVENGEFIAGLTSEYIYSLASRTTTVKTTEAADSEEGETAANVINTVYTFGEEGNVLSQYAYSEDTGNVGTTGTASGIIPISSDSGVVSNINNLLREHGFEYDYAWTNKDDNSTDLVVNKSISSGFLNYGERGLRLKSEGTSVNADGVYQWTGILPVGEYTMSVYARILDAFTTIGSMVPGAFIRVLDEDDNILSESEHYSTKENEYVRLVAPFSLATAQSVKVELLVSGAGTVLFDAAQLENNPYANAYNMLENGNFELIGDSNWLCTDATITDEASFNMSKSMKLQGYLDYQGFISQIVKVRKDKSVRETFTLSGWAKANSVPKRARVGSEDSQFRLRAVIHYVGEEYESETYTSDFSPVTTGWQFTSLQFAKAKFGEVDYIEVFCDYDYNYGVVFVDDMQLVRDSIEEGLGTEDFVILDVDYYEADVDDVSIEEYTAPVFGEKIDVYGNSLTDTQFTDGEFGTIYRAFGFTPDGADVANAGNDLIRETDERGNVTSYTVNEETSRNEEVTDRLGNKTAYEYDLAGRTTKVTNKNAAGTELANVSYSYDSFDNMTEIVRGDGMKYVLAYNAYHNLESIGINGKSEKLVQYTYKNGNGRLKAITYANGDIMKASYNSIGQLIAEKWFNSLETLTAHYKYVYDGQGNIVRSVDVLNNKEYMYIYEGERLVRSVENDVVITNDLVTKRTVAASVYYMYDSEGNITKKRIVTGTDEQVIYLEKAENDSTVVKFTVGGKTITSHSKTDSFGRKVFDELQLGTGFASRQFEYHVGEVTDEHVDNEMLKSTPTTQLVSSISFSDGRIISYEYDAEERITKVIDSIEGTSEYTYDALGQLIKEVYDGDTINEMTYDNYGNILTKNGVAYTYGDTVWKDKLTAVGNETITYDAQGNPINYLGHTLTWEKGRQLKSFDNYSYTYNANGIRTSKTIDGVKHTYLLDGTKILKETWGTNTLIPMYDNEESVCGIIYNDEPYYFLKNLQGDVISIVDKASEVVAKYIYDAWGVCTVTWDDTYCAIADINPFRYRGYYYDDETGLYYLQSRYYDPYVGRFVNSDSTKYINIGITILCLCIFNYCENNAINSIDSNGLYTMSINDFKSDWAGRTILADYLYGKGKTRIYNNSKWANYMKKCKMCKCCGYNSKITLETYINNYVKGQKRAITPNYNGGTKTVTKSIAASITNGESIYGYNYLHGTNPRVGNLKIKMVAKRNNFKITVDIYCRWNDIIDPNFSYQSDSYKAALAQKIPFANPADYIIRINWQQKLNIAI